jgi:hypothetical protein
LDDAGTAADDGFRAVCRRQAALGIEVRVLRPADVPPAAGRPTGFAVFDDAVGYESTPSRPAGDETRLTLGAEALKANADRFDALWRAAEPFSG